jgi:hypothetical protein
MRFPVLQKNPAGVWVRFALFMLAFVIPAIAVASTTASQEGHGSPVLAELFALTERRFFLSAIVKPLDPCTFGGGDRGRRVHRMPSGS